MRGGAEARLALAVLVLAAGAAPGEVRPDFRWTSAGDDFGGISDLLMSPDGQGMIAVSDRGSLYEASVTRGADGAIADVRVTARLRPKDNFGRPVSGFRQDAEDLARGPDGRLFIAFESYARVTGFDPPDMTAYPTHVWDRFKGFWGNAGFEALAPLPGGGLVAVLETARDGAYRTFLWSGDDWTEGPVIPGADGYSASGADLGPDGAIYLLERSHSVVFGYQTRVRRLAPPDDAWGAGTTVYEAEYSENFEGISLWRDASGALWMTLVSDDNFALTGATWLREVRLGP